MVRGIDEVEGGILKLLMGCKQGKDLNFVSKLLKLDSSLVQKKLQGLVELGFLEVEGDKYKLSERGKRYLRFLLERKRIWSETRNVYNLHPAGDVRFDIGLVFEPLNYTQVVYWWLGKKGITELHVDPRTRGGYFKIGDCCFYLEGELLTQRDFIFSSPDESIVNKWVEGRHPSLSTQQLWDKLNKYFRLFLDLQEDCYYDLLCITVFQSWLRKLLNSVWFLSVIGEFGGGKTVIGEALVSVCYHGYFVANPSVAFVGRCYDRLHITPFFDEFDSIAGTKDGELYQIVREAQRKGGRYSRMSERGKPQTFEVFGTTLFAVHGELERALTTRNIPVFTQESVDYRLPILNLLKQGIGKRLYTELLLWYMDNIVQINLLNKVVDPLSIFESHTKALELRNLLGEQLCKVYTPQQIEQLSKLKGRTAEIACLLYQVSNLIGLKLDFKRVFKIRMEHLEELREIDRVGLLREYLIRLYKEKKGNTNYITNKGEFMISNLELKNGFNVYLRNLGHAACSPAEFCSLLRDLGFTRPHSRKHERIWTEDELNELSREELRSKVKPTRLCNIFTERVCRRLGIKYVNLLPQSNMRDLVEK